jgi:hypothetical protein
MIKTLRYAVLAWMAAATAAIAATQTNVLQTINLQLTIYQQGSNLNGKKISDQVTSLTSKSLIQALETVTGQQFVGNPKLVQSTVYQGVEIINTSGANPTVLTTNMEVDTNAYVDVGGTAFYSSLFSGGNVVLNGNTFISDGFGSIASDVISTVGGASTNSVTINTNSGFVTTITLSTNNSGQFTNALIVTQQGTVESVLTNVSSSVDVLYNGSTLYAVDSYLHFLPAESAQILVETGSGLGTTNATLETETGFSIQGLSISYSMPTGPTNLTLTLTGFVKEGLKVDTLAKKVVQDVFGANATWNVVGSGFAGGTFTTQQTSVSVQNGYLTNANPVVVNGSVNLSFLKNLAQ